MSGSPIKKSKSPIAKKSPSSGRKTQKSRVQFVPEKNKTLVFKTPFESSQISELWASNEEQNQARIESMKDEDSVYTNKTPRHIRKAYTTKTIKNANKEVSNRKVLPKLAALDARARFNIKFPSEYAEKPKSIPAPIVVRKKGFFERLFGSRKGGRTRKLYNRK